MCVWGGGRAGRYAPFSLGPRDCIGRNFALLETKMVLATILSHFSVALVPGARPVRRGGVAWRGVLRRRMRAFKAVRAWQAKVDGKVVPVRPAGGLELCFRQRV